MVPVGAPCNNRALQHIIDSNYAKRLCQLRRQQTSYMAYGRSMTIVRFCYHHGVPMKRQYSEADPGRHQVLSSFKITWLSKLFTDFCYLSYNGRMLKGAATAIWRNGKHLKWKDNKICLKVKLRLYESTQFYWQRNVVKHSIGYENVCPTVCLSHLIGTRAGIAYSATSV